MSHELRTPLNGILGFTQVLHADKSLTERQARSLAIIEQSGRHLLALIDDVLDMARVDAGKLALNLAPVELNTFLRVVADIVSVKADEKNLLFRFDAAADLPHVVQVDEMRLRQVLLNLLSNAVKFTDSGIVGLRVKPLVRGGHGHSMALRFEVEDSGIGMTEEQIVRLFQPFEQVGDARRRAGGTGLGLAISRQLVRLMGGDIQVSSEPGRGTLFWFELIVPVHAHARPDAGDAPGEPIGYAGARRKVLVVDDAPAVRAWLAEALAPLGFDVAEAADGEEGLRRAAEVMPDLVVMDVAMPVLDGVEATRRLRRMPQLAAVPVIATSASPSALVMQRCRDAGADGFLPKPIDRKALLQTIGERLLVQWVRRDAGMTPAPAQEIDAGALFIPPREEMELLQRLARMGSMREIRERADYLRTLDPRYAAFSQRLRNLAERYQSKAIATLVGA
jgi:CheY-like chemotaxis protein